MKIVYVQTYPAYHDFGDDQKWLKLENRDKWMPALTKETGHDCELWCGALNSGTFIQKHRDLPELIVRFFKTDTQDGKSKTHISSEMLACARNSKADFFVLKGVDGGIGTHLLREYILPAKIPFAFVIGGSFYSRYNKDAKAILYETEYQKKQLMQPGLNIWRKRAKPEQLIRLPKSIDCDIFRPFPETQKKYDIISMGRLISYYKNYDALRKLSKKLRVGFIGGGPELERFKKEMPEIDWIGYIPNKNIPEYLSKGSVFFYTGLRDYFPRVIPEAAACGLPVVAFEKIIKEDVLPVDIGLRLTKNGYLQEIEALCNDRKIIEKMGKEARKYALKHWNMYSSRKAIQQMIDLVNT